MATQAECIKKYGNPQTVATKNNWIAIWDIPKHLRLKNMPPQILCNTDLIIPLSRALYNLRTRGFERELQTFDGCYNVRPIRGYENARPVRWSMHSWGIAVDFNAATNRLGQKPTLSAGFVKCFTDSGFRWGGTFTRKDGMHFELETVNTKNIYTPSAPVSVVPDNQKVYDVRKPLMRSPFIKKIQEHAADYLNEKRFVANDIYDERCKGLIRRFQAMAELWPIDGIAGPQTLKALGL